MLDLSRWLLPAAATEDDSLVASRSTDDENTLTLRVRVDAAATERAREEASELIDELREGDRGGDVTL